MIAAGLWLALASPALAEAPDNWKFTLDGYYRARGHAFYDLYDGQAAPGTYITNRIRMQPGLNFEDRAKVFMMFDAMDGVVWGDNASLASTSLFAADPSTTTIEGTEVVPFQLKRVWTEFKVPVGLFRVGRQGSNWGMGLLANEGNGFDDTFGENKYGSTYDRIMFATRPITVATTIAQMAGGKGKVHDVPLITAFGVDRLVEDPLIQYYGYGCDPESPDDRAAGCSADEDHSTTVERDAERRTDTWWVDNQDDVYEMVYVLIYRGEGTRLSKDLVGDITAGVYVVNRLQGETSSDVLIIDGYVKTEIKNTLFEGEILHIGGDTRAITLANPDPDAKDPLAKTADIWGYVLRAGYQDEHWTALMEHGYASGDDQPTDVEFTGRPLHPDFNVGLLLYEEVIARTTANAWGPSAKGLWSNGGVYNSRYIFPNVRYRPIENWEFSAAFLMAWPDKPDGSRILCKEGDAVTCTTYTASSDYLGWETDVAIKHNFADHHINLTLEAGMAHATDRLPLASARLATDTNDKGEVFGQYYTIQSRVAYEF